MEPAPIVTKKDETVQPVEESPASSSMQTDRQSSVYRQGPRREASREIINVLEKFSMVTKFARDTTAHLFGENRLLGNSEMDFDRGPMRSVFWAIQDKTNSLACSLKRPIIIFRFPTTFFPFALIRLLDCLASVL